MEISSWFKPSKKSAKSIISNAKIHVNKKYILNLDIKDFFPSIRKADLHRELLALFGEHYRIPVSAVVILSTYQDVLPAGSPASPILSNLYCVRMDHEIMELCRHYDITYTRYADDMTFSADKPFADFLMLVLKDILEKYNFSIHPEKIRALSAHKRQTVTGLVVNKKLNVRRNYKKKLRAILHDVEVNGWYAAGLKHYKRKEMNENELMKFRNKVKGMQNFVRQVKKNEV